MITKNKYRILIWLVAILLATNLSMAISFIYHKNREYNESEETQQTEFFVPEEQRSRFFREYLTLHPSQTEIFRELNRDFNRTASQINKQLNILRIEMVKELGRENPRQKELDAISEKIGELHTELKNVTIRYYLTMREQCNEEQEKKLNAIFMSVLRNNEDIKLPGRGRRRGHNW